MNLTHFVRLSCCCLAFSTLMISCQGPQTIAYDGAAEMEVVDEFLVAIQNADMETARSLITDESITYGPAVTDSLTANEWNELWVDNFKNRIKEISYERTASRYFLVTPQQNPLLSGHWVMEWGIMSSNYLNGTSASFWWHGAFKVEDGKIALSRVFYDRADLLTQTGWSLQPPHEEGDDTNDNEEESHEEGNDSNEEEDHN